MADNVDHAEFIPTLEPQYTRRLNARLIEHDGGVRELSYTSYSVDGYTPVMVPAPAPSPTPTPAATPSLSPSSPAIAPSPASGVVLDEQGFTPSFEPVPEF